MVTDATGLKGKYDFTLSWLPGNAALIAATPDTETLPDLFNAVQQQFGLKLEPNKARVDILVVDHIEKVPIGN
jgi:uncharacterized protein (TIGR03435 family)